MDSVLKFDNKSMAAIAIEQIKLMGESFMDSKVSEHCKKFREFMNVLTFRTLNGMALELRC